MSAAGRGTRDLAAPEAPEAPGGDPEDVPVGAARAPRPYGSLRWPAVVALTAALGFAGLVAAGVFDPMIEAL